MNKNRALTIGTSLFVIATVCAYFNSDSMPVSAMPTVSVSQDKTVTSVGQQVIVSINCHPSSPIKAWELKVKFNQSLYRADMVLEGNFFRDYETFFLNGVIDNVNGTIINILDVIMGQGNITEDGTLATITFTCLDVKTSPLELYDVGLTNESQYINITVQQDGEISASQWGIFG
jgi:hypothetical protein